MMSGNRRTAAAHPAPFMSAYLVRLAPTRELVGIFVCKRAALAWWIDGECDPSECEYVELGPGYLYWGAGAPAVPLTMDADFEIVGRDLDWNGCGPSEGGHAALVHCEGDEPPEWHPVVE